MTQCTTTRFFSFNIFYRPQKKEWKHTPKVDIISPKRTANQYKCRGKKERKKRGGGCIVGKGSEMPRGSGVNGQAGGTSPCWRASQSEK